MDWLRRQPMFVQVMVFFVIIDLLRRYVLDSAILAGFVRGLFG